MLEVRDVTKRYGDRAVVRQVGFSVQPGEILALLGPNGAGKTTLIRMITDIIRPDEGSIHLDGRLATPDDRRLMAYLPEERGLYRRTPVAEVVAYYGMLKGLRAPDARSEALRLLERIELGEWTRKQVQALSKGMQQKVQLCTVLIGNPRLIILDEPFTGLDPLNTQLLEEMLLERRAQGVTLLLSTHQMNKVEQLCDRALMINRGRMVLYGPVRELRRSYSDHAVQVRCDVPLEGAPGVASVEHKDGDQLVRFGADGTSRQLMAWLAERGAEVEHFALAAMPLEDIFVKVVREGIGLDRGESSLEPAEAGR